MASPIVQVPTWVLALRGIQLLFAVVVLGMSSYGVYWLRLSSWGWAIFTSLVTVVIVLYSVVPERVAAASKLYSPYVILALNAVAVVIWLAAMGALAARRSTFKYSTTISTCVNDGSGGVCVKRRDSDLQKRGGYVATYPYLNMMSAAAVFSAFEMLVANLPSDV
ncbi:hypothetical protein BJ875DRAFT_507022 [Amylocarpus encephaloides]|uniref:MARVEL domain-containing protein n=1 Tax=Amylocarpus encephaloides TaxID=45428 RepID=A0A9P7YCN4_9HELO|nr:hypothetical protein BJ875DRAFT_507022 [Amylocarpus encephaloides]